MDKIKLIVDKYTKKDETISALHDIQNEFGYIPDEACKYISSKLNIAMSEIYGLITFYSRFSEEKKGKYIIQVCMGTACYVKGAEEIYNKFKSELNLTDKSTTDDMMFTLESVRCIGACGLAPAVSINGEVYGKVTTDKVVEIINKLRSE